MNSETAEFVINLMSRRNHGVGRWAVTGEEFRAAVEAGVTYFVGADIGPEADLEDADLSGCNLQGAAFRKARLSGAEFALANLAYANFDGADLTDAQFAGANLYATDFRGSNVTGDQICQGVGRDVAIDDDVFFAVMRVSGLHADLRAFEWAGDLYITQGDDASLPAAKFGPFVVRKYGAESMLAKTVELIEASYVEFKRRQMARAGQA
jgi:hypothetical protein